MASSADHHAAQPYMAPTTFPERRLKNTDGTPPAPSTRALRKHHQAARYFAKKRYAANMLLYHHHTNAPVIETYYPPARPLRPPTRTTRRRDRPGSDIVIANAPASGRPSVHLKAA